MLHVSHGGFQKIFGLKVNEDTLLVSGHGLPPTVLSLNYDQVGGGGEGGWSFRKLEWKRLGV